MEGVGSGRYTLNAGTPAEGAYRFRATASKDGRTLGTATGGFAVGALTLEFQETRANVSLMRQVARRSGGAFMVPSSSAALASQLAESAHLQALVQRRTTESELWRRYGFMIAIVVLLTLEWFLRKRSGMV